MLITVSLIIFAASLIMMVGSILMAVQGAKEHVAWCIGALFMPMIGIIFTALHWKKYKWARRGFFVYIGGIVAMIGACISFFAASPGLTAELFELQEAQENLNRERVSLLLRKSAGEEDLSEALDQLREEQAELEARQTEVIIKMFFGPDAPILDELAISSSAEDTTAERSEAPPPGDPFEGAMKLAVDAEAQMQTAETKADWREVADTWALSVTLLELVPDANPNYATAQTKIMVFNQNQDYAESNAQ